MAEIDDLIQQINDELVELEPVLRRVRSKLEQGLGLLEGRLEKLANAVTSIEEQAGLPRQMLDEAAIAVASRMDVLFDTVAAELAEMHRGINNHINQLSSAIDEFGDGALETVDEFRAGMSDLLVHPLEQVRQAYAAGLEEVLNNLQSEILEPALDHVTAEVKESLEAGLDEVEAFFQEEAEAAAKQLKQALNQSLEANAALEAATDQLEPIMDQLKPMTQAVASVASSVGIG